MNFPRYDALDIRELYDAEERARRNGRDDAADALRRRRENVAIRSNGSDARYACGRCGSPEVDAREIDRHNEVARHALICRDCEQVVGTKIDGLSGTSGKDVTGVREITVS